MASKLEIQNEKDIHSGAPGYLHDSSTVEIVDQQQQAIDLTDQPIDDRPPRKFLWLVPLTAHVHPIQFFLYIFSVFVSMAIIVYFATAQSWVIISLLGVPSSQQGDVTGSLGTYSEVMSVVAVVVWGNLSDRVMKRTVIAISLVIMGVMVIVYPYMPTVYPGLLLIRLVYSIGTAGTTCMMAAMMTEVIHGQGGMVSGIIGICSGLGAIFASFVLVDIPVKLVYVAPTTSDTIRYTYVIIGSVTTALGFLLWRGMPANRFGRRLTFYELVIVRLRDGFSAARDPRVALGFASSFFARADEVIITNFISLWITQYYIDTGVCSADRVCYAAQGSTGTLTGIAQSFALISAPFFGIGSEYLPKEIPLLIAGIVGACGTIPFSFSIDPSSKASMAFIVLTAIGQYGKSLKNKVLDARYSLTNNVSSRNDCFWYGHDRW